MSIAIIKYNAGNTASVTNALLRLGITPTITDDAAAIRAASRVIFPGVGHAQPAMAYLRERGLDAVIRGLTQPFLGICLGLQLLCEWSEEGDTACIGIYPTKVRRFGLGQKVPHMGWNQVALDVSGSDGKMLWTEDRWYYFLHAYRADLGSNTIATCHYGENFSAMMRKDNFWAVQFHPEKSDRSGAKLLKGFLEQ